MRTQNEAYAQKRVFSPGVVTPRGNEQAGHALLDEFLMLHPHAADEATGESDDRRHERLHQPPARIGVTGFGCHHQIAFLPRRESTWHGSLNPRVTPQLVQSQGLQLATMQELARYWGTDYDLRRF